MSTRQGKSVHWWRYWRDWVLPMALSVAATITVVAAFFGWPPFGLAAPVCEGSPERVCHQPTDRERLDQRTADVETAAKAATGLLAFAAGFVALRSHLLRREELEATTDDSQRRYRLAERQQRLDQYVAMITQLGSSSLDVRVGGLFALEALVVDHANEYASVGYEVLVAYLQAHVPRNAHDGEVPVAPGELRWATDVRAAWTILTRRRTLFDRHVPALGADHDDHETGIHLVRFDGRGLLFAGCSLSGATLRDCDFRDAAFVACDGVGATITGTAFDHATLRDTTLRSSSILRCAFPGADLRRCSFAESRLTRTWFGSAVIEDCSFRSTELIECSLAGATVAATSWDDARIDGALRDGVIGTGAEPVTDPEPSPTSPLLADAPRTLARLTDREATILQLVEQGLDTDQIASHLGMSPKTVRNRLLSIRAKLTGGG